MLDKREEDELREREREIGLGFTKYKMVSRIPSGDRDTA
jgi:hypothetical protein